jgi:hypothetical protein
MFATSPDDVRVLGCQLGTGSGKRLAASGITCENFMGDTPDPEFIGSLSAWQKKA